MQISNGGITVLPTQDCLSSSNFIFGFYKIFSSSHVSSSLGRSFHFTKYYLMVLLLNILSLVFKIFFGTSVRWPSSSKGGSISEVTIFWPRSFLRQETWNTLWIYSLLEVLIHMLPPQSSELPCMGRNILVLAFMPQYFLDMFVCMDANSNILNN